MSIQHKTADIIISQTNSKPHAPYKIQYKLKELLNITLVEKHQSLLDSVNECYTRRAFFFNHVIVPVKKLLVKI